ncbi:hypothetical protein TH606_07515 [Thermodesulfatator autotrophicus]|uniref:Outer-membrane lipoprotein carrier protein n=2 Tax=Thermodesulfatator autotrophicus TaxID=1795632 RepID=A0A177E7V5_9BACT|nr:hypothetical protein TH606_07515 [Thermodesulfatator autotrophicus]
MVCVLVLFFCVLISKPLIAASSAEDIAKRVQAYYQATQSFTGEFEQEVYFKRGNQVKISKGRVFYKKPALMRWEYQWPEELLIIIDGKGIYVYSPKDKQVMVFSLEHAFPSKATLDFLTGQGNLFKDFNFGPLEQLSQKEVALSLFPKDKNAQVQKIRLIVYSETGAIKEIWFWDALENLTKIKFFNIKRNVDIKSSIFSFKPPENVEIIRER